MSLLEIDHTEVSVSKGTMYNILVMLEDLLIDQLHPTKEQLELER